jgi:signal transduction histidine kinase
MIKKIICFIPIIFTVIAGHTQDKKIDKQDKRIDSLKLLLSQEKKDSAKFLRLIQIGEAYQKITNDSALVYFQDALRWSEKIGFKEGEIQARSRMANFLWQVKSDYATALELYFQNLKVEEQTGDTAYIFSDTRNAVFIYHRIENFEKALEYTNKLRHLISSGIFKDSAKLATYRVVTDNWFGSVYIKMNKLDSAKYYMSREFNYGMAKKDWLRIALGSLGLGNIYRKLKNRDSAFYYYRVGMPAAFKGENEVYRNYLVTLGNFFWEDKQIDSALYYSQKAFSLSQGKKDFPKIISAAELLAEIYYVKNQPDSAYRYLKQSVLLKDSIFSSEKIARIQSLSLNESLEKLQEEQTKKEAVQEYKSRIKIYSLAAGLAILLILIFILYRNNRQRQFANKKIEKAYTDLKSTQAQLIQSEKMASLGELTAGIAHEIQNPLNFVNNFSEVNTELIEDLRGERSKVKGERNEQLENEILNDIEQNLQKINHHGKRADAIVKGMLQHSRSSSGQKEPTDINKLADEYLRLCYHGLRAKDQFFNATIKTDYDESLEKINIIHQDIGRVVLNLFTNAFYAVTEKRKEQPGNYEPTVTITTSSIQLPLGGRGVVIRVIDNGGGIPQKVLDKIFQPFFTTKPTGQGTGLGLSLSYDIITKGHGGELKVETKEGEGCEFIIQIPVG